MGVWVCLIMHPMHTHMPPHYPTAPHHAAFAAPCALHMVRTWLCYSPRCAKWGGGAHLRWSPQRFFVAAAAATFPCGHLHRTPAHAGITAAADGAAQRAVGGAPSPPYLAFQRVGVLCAAPGACAAEGVQLRATAAGGAGVAAHLGLQLSPFPHLCGEGPP